MADKKQDFIDQRLQDLNNDGVDRRGFLKCMAWAGTGLVWTLSGGVPVSRAFAQGAGEQTGIMGGDRNKVRIVSRTGIEEWPEMGKDEVAARLAALIAERLQTVVV